MRTPPHKKTLIRSRLTKTIAETDRILEMSAVKDN